MVIYNSDKIEMLLIFFQVPTLLSIRKLVGHDRS
jgi:hypothetical protein